MDILFIPLLSLILTILKFYTFCVFGFCIMSLLDSFQIINRYNRTVYSIFGFFFRIVEPSLVFIRRFIPLIRGIDFSPFALLLFLFFIENIINRILIRFPL